MTRFTLVPERSSLTALAKSNVHPIHGEGRSLTGYVEVEIVDGRIDLTTSPGGRIELATEDLHADHALIEREIQRRLDARRYPTVRGEVRDTTELAPGKYHVSGDLSLHGATQRVDGIAEATIDGDTLEAEGDLTLDLRDFGLPPPKILMLRVYPDVNVHVHIVA